MAANGTLGGTGGILPGFTETFTAIRGVTAGTATLRPQYLNKMNDSSNLRSFSANASRLQYNIPRRTVDLRTRFTLTRHADVYFDVANIFNEPDSGSVFYANRPRQIKRLSPLLSVGINTRL